MKQVSVVCSFGDALSLQQVLGACSVGDALFLKQVFGTCFLGMNSKGWGSILERDCNEANMVIALFMTI